VKFSAQFVVAACLLKGHFDLPDLSPTAMADPKVRELATRVKCKADPESQFPTYFSGGVTVRLADGRELKRHVPVNSGAGARALTQEALLQKFMASAGLTISADRAAEVAEYILEMERLSAREIAAKLRGV
jgi:2-methylcitrate dehydratase PrpD